MDTPKTQEQLVAELGGAKAAHLRAIDEHVRVEAALSKLNADRAKRVSDLELELAREIRAAQERLDAARQARHAALEALGEARAAVIEHVEKPLEEAAAARPSA